MRIVYRQVYFKRWNEPKPCSFQGSNEFLWRMRIFRARTRRIMHYHRVVILKKRKQRLPTIRTV